MPQAQVAAARQDLANSDGFALQQELIVKTLLSRTGTADPLLRDARVIPTTPIDVPAEDSTPHQQYLDDAFRNRPELQGGKLQIENTQISMQGARNEMRPELDLVGTVQNSGLAGQSNPLRRPRPPASPNVAVSPALSRAVSAAPARRQIPTPQLPHLRHRDSIEYCRCVTASPRPITFVTRHAASRQTQIRMQQLQNQVRLEVEKARSLRSIRLVRPTTPP